MRLARRKLPPRVARVARAELGVARGELALLLGYLLLPVAFAVCWILASIEGLFASWFEIVVLILGSVFLPLFLARFWARIDPSELDETLEADGVLLTWLGGRDGIVRELLTRDLELLARRTTLAEKRRNRLLRLVPRLLLYFLLFLLLALLLPGHGPGQGSFPGGSPGAQSGPQGSGETGEGEHSEKDRPRETEREKPDEKKEQDEPEKAPQPAGSGEGGPDGEGKPDAPLGGVQFQDFLVFPDFREGEAKATRDTGAIDRAPRALEEGSRERPGGATGGSDEAAQRSFEWKRQSERALRRGTLHPWEGRWLTRYGELLEAGRPKPAETKDDGK